MNSTHKINLDAVDRWMELYNDDPHRMIDECYAPDATATSPGVFHSADPATFHQLETSVLNAIPDRRARIIETHALGDKVVVEASLSYTDPRDGQAHETFWCAILTFRDGLITTDHSYMDWTVLREIFQASVREQAS